MPTEAPVRPPDTPFQKRLWAWIRFASYLVLASPVLLGISIGLHMKRDKPLRGRIYDALDSTRALQQSVEQLRADGCAVRWGVTRLRTSRDSIVAYTDVTGGISFDIPDDIAPAAFIQLRPRISQDRVQWQCRGYGVQRNLLPPFCRGEGVEREAQAMPPPSKAGCLP